MPIRPEFRRFYGREWREVTRPRILARTKNACEQCGAPNHRLVSRNNVNNPSWWAPHLGQWFSVNGTPPWRWTDTREILVVLMVAHLNHVPGDDRDENLRAFCGWCHLNYDAAHHKETRCLNKDAARPLLAAAC